jgi:hypothetical protein
MKFENTRMKMGSMTRGICAIGAVICLSSIASAESFISSVEGRSRLGVHTPYTNYSYHLMNPTDSSEGDIYSNSVAWAGLGNCASSICASNDTTEENSRLCLSGNYETSSNTSASSFMQWRVKGTFDTQLSFGEGKRFNFGFHVNDAFFSQGHANNNILVSLTLQGQTDAIYLAHISQSEYSAGMLETMGETLWESTDGLLAGSLWTMNIRVQGSMLNSQAIDGHMFNAHVETFDALPSIPVPGIGVAACVGIGFGRRGRRRSSRQD